jgi:hypothetical protein
VVGDDEVVAYSTAAEKTSAPFTPYSLGKKPQSMFDSKMMLDASN